MDQPVADVHRTAVPFRSDSMLGMSDRRLHVAMGVVFLVFATAAAYWPALHGGFILDDNLLLTDNPLIKAPDGLIRFWTTSEAPEYYPISYSTLWLEWRLWGPRPTGYHFTNLCLHIAAALVLWAVLQKLSLPGAFLAALLFAVHPVNVESVAWIAQRRNVAAIVLFLISVFCYLRNELGPAVSDKKTRGVAVSFGLWYWLSLFTFVLAMLSKGSAAVLPAVLLGIVLWRRPLARADAARLAPFFVVAIILTVVHIWFQTHGQDITYRVATFPERLAGAGGVVWFYLSKALAPIGLIFVYPQWQIQSDNLLWWLPLLAAAAFTAALWHNRKTPRANWGRPVLFAWAFFCVALLPVMGFANVAFMQYSLVADHYQYIALIGLVALVAANLRVWHSRSAGAIRMAASITAIALVGVLSLLTWRQSRLYADGITLYQATLQRNPTSWLAQTNLGAELLEQGQLNQAIEYCSQAVRQNPHVAVAHSNLGNALLKAGRPQQALEHGQEALRLAPDSAAARNNLGNALSQLARVPEAIQQYQQALLLMPDYADAHYNLGNALFQIDRIPEAIQQYQQALPLNPDSPGIHNNLANALTKAGRFPEALQQYQETLRLEPNNLKAYSNLTTAYIQMQRPAEAIATAQQALALARSQGDQAAAQKIEGWLTRFAADTSSVPDGASQRATPNSQP